MNVPCLPACTLPYEMKGCVKQSFCMMSVLNLTQTPGPQYFPKKSPATPSIIFQVKNSESFLYVSNIKLSNMMCECNNNLMARNHTGVPQKTIYREHQLQKHWEGHDSINGF